MESTASHRRASSVNMVLRVCWRAARALSLYRHMCARTHARRASQRRAEYNIYIYIYIYRVSGIKRTNARERVERSKLKRKVLYYFAKFAIVIALLIKISELMSAWKAVGRNR